MYRTRNTNWTTRNTLSVDVKVLGKALLWLAAGGLLGLAVALPYDRLLGLPSATGTVLASVVWAVLLGISYPSRTS
jgi:hypothetical protein